MFINKKWVLLTLLMLIISGVFGILIMSIPRIWNFEGTSGDWLSYWGGVIGSLLGVVGAIIVFSIQSDEEKRNTRAIQVDNTFFNLLNFHNMIKSKIEENNHYFDDILDSIKSEKIKKETSVSKLMRKEVFNRERKEIKSILKKIVEKSYSDIVIEKCFTTQFSDNILSQDEHDLYESECRAAYYMFEEIRSEECKENLESVEGEYNTLCKVEALQKSIERNDVLTNIQNNIIDSGIKVELKYEEEIEIVEYVYSLYHNIFGDYLRIFHRIVMYINRNVSEKCTKTDYIAFLRTIISDKEMMIISYYVFYTSRGMSLKKELIETNFFDDEGEFDFKKNVFTIVQ